MGQLQLERLLADQTLERGDPRLLGLDQVGGVRIVFERARLVLVDPDPDQVARDVVALRQALQGLAGQGTPARPAA